MKNEVLTTLILVIAIGSIIIGIDQFLTKEALIITLVCVMGYVYWIRNEVDIG